MPPAPVAFYFDYVDPASYVLDALLERAFEGIGELLDRRPFEMRPPPLAIPDPDDPDLRDRRHRARVRAREEGVPLVTPQLTPWSRKAHELALHAREKGCFRDVHRALFRAHFVEGQDIGRIDVLVRLADRAGLDATEAKAVLDVDRFLEPLEKERAEARSLGVRVTPTLLVAGESIEGLPDAEELAGMLRSPAS